MTRAVLVTGASRGIGAAVAHAFAASGDRVAVHYGASKAGLIAFGQSLARALGPHGIDFNGASYLRM